MLHGSHGANHFAFNGRIGGQTLGAGSYQQTATPSNGKPKDVTFAITA